MEWTKVNVLVDPDAGPLGLTEPPKKAMEATADDGMRLIARLHGGGLGVVAMGGRIVVAGRPGGQPYRLLLSVLPPGRELVEPGDDPDRAAELLELDPPRAPTLVELAEAVHLVVPRGVIMRMPDIVSSGEAPEYEAPPGGTVFMELVQVGEIPALSQSRILEA